MGHLGLKTWSHCSNMDNILGDIFDSPVIELGQNACQGNCSDQFDGSGERSGGHLGPLVKRVVCVTKEREIITQNLLKNVTNILCTV
jgi:hypothetical protein